MATLKKQTSDRTGVALTSSPGDFPASRSASPGNGKEPPMSATCGPTCLEQYGRSDHNGSWAKMFAELLVGMAEWSSSRYRLSWRLKDTRFNRMYFLLQVSALRTVGSGFGLLPTPVAMDTGAMDIQKIDERRERLKAMKMNGNGFGMSLAEMVQRMLLPTPIVSDATVGAIIGKTTDSNQPKVFQERSIRMASREVWGWRG